MTTAPRAPLASLALLWFVLWLAPACADSSGRDCEGSDECDDGQVCAPQVAGCTRLDDCPGICGEPCVRDDQCEDGQRCQAASGTPIAICVERPDPGDE